MGLWQIVMSSSQRLICRWWLRGVDCSSVGWRRGRSRTGACVLMGPPRRVDAASIRLSRDWLTEEAGQVTLSKRRGAGHRARLGGSRGLWRSLRALRGGPDITSGRVANREDWREVAKYRHRVPLGLGPSRSRACADDVLVGDARSHLRDSLRAFR